MKFIFSIPIWGIWGVALAATERLGIADPSATVPVLPYQTVFSPGAEPSQLGAIDWRQANAEVGRFRRGHADVLKWEAEQTRPAVPPGQQPALSPTQLPGQRLDHGPHQH